MKKTYLKKWIEYLIHTIDIILVCLLLTLNDSKDFKSLVIFVILSLIVLYFNYRIIKKYGRNKIIED